MKIFEEIMHSLDRNCNGAIDYTEFLTAASDKEQLLSDLNLRFAFNMFDTDRSGSISKAELKMLFESSEKKDDALWNEIFAEVDTDGDGEISFEEFQHAMQRVITHSKENKYITRVNTEEKNAYQKEIDEQNVKQMFTQEPVDPQ